MIPAIPSGLLEIEAVFGFPGYRATHSGRVYFPVPLRLGWQPDVEVRSASCHLLMQDVFTEVFRLLHERGFWPLLESFDGIYNYRPTRKGKKLSVHAWGIAVDLNATRNRLGEKPTMDHRIVATFEELGFLWGGRWRRPDGMHFQYALHY